MVAEVAHLLAGVVLALAFVLLTRRRIRGLFAVVQAQSVAVAAAAAWLALSAGSAVLWGLALVVLIGGAVALPRALRRSASADDVVNAPRAPLTMTAAAAVVVLAILVVLPAHLPGLPSLRENLALALSAVLIALLMLPTRRDALPQLVGLLALANGVALVAVTVGAQLAAPLAVGVALLFGFVAVGLAVRP
jgi:hydrogenase-4 component E